MPSDWELLTQNGGQSFPLSDAFPVGVLETDMFSTFRIKTFHFDKGIRWPWLLNYGAIGSDCRRTSCDTPWWRHSLPVYISHFSLPVHKLWPCLPMLSFFFSRCPHAHLVTSAFLPVKRLFILPSYPHTLPPQSAHGVRLDFSRIL